MKIVGWDRVDGYIKRHRKVEQDLLTWCAVTGKESWRKPKDITRRFRSIDFQSGNRVIFDLEGSSLKLVVEVAYHASVVRVVWVGSYEEFETYKL